MFFFFQAEDGIRDLVRSRGLGDVYKRQRRMFLTALIVPDFEAVKEYADARKIPYDKVEDLVRDEEIYKMLDKEMDQFQKKLANYERVRKFVLLDRPFTIESGEITPKLSVKRKFVEERYKDLIEQMYQSLDLSLIHISEPTRPY